jgi:hypothetical protein
VSEITAKAVLERMVRELAEHDWPTEQTWRDAFKVLGRPPIEPINPGEPMNAMRAAMVAAQEQK